jgi:trehalose 6-phosphate synthase/phosphatase
LQETCPGSFLEEKEYSLAWHYRNAEEDKGNKYSRKLISTLSSGIHTRNLRIIDGNKVVEVTAAGVSKGNAVKSLLTENDYDFILCAGDDRTDEDMFFMLRKYDQAVTIKIGGGETLARHRTEDPRTFLSLLGHLAGQNKSAAGLSSFQ